MDSLKISGTDGFPVDRVLYSCGSAITVYCWFPGCWFPIDNSLHCIGGFPECVYGFPVDLGSLWIVYCIYSQLIIYIYLGSLGFLMLTVICLIFVYCA